MIDRCNIIIRQAWNGYNILSLFFFNYVTQDEPFPCLPLEYEMCCYLCYWALLPEAENPPWRNNVDVRLTDWELNLIKQWEIRFQRKETTCGDKMTQVWGWRHGERTRQDAPEVPLSHTWDVCTNSDVINQMVMVKVHKVRLKYHRRTL